MKSTFFIFPMGPNCDVGGCLFNRDAFTGRRTRWAWSVRFIPRCANGGDSSDQGIKTLCYTYRPHFENLRLIAECAATCRLCSSGCWTEEQRWEEAGMVGWVRRSHHHIIPRGFSSSLPFFDSWSFCFSFPGALNLFSPPHYLTFMRPSSLNPAELISRTPPLDSPTVINPAPTRQQRWEPLIPEAKLPLLQSSCKVARDLNQPAIRQNP